MLFCFSIVISEVFQALINRDLLLQSSADTYESIALISLILLAIFVGRRSTSALIMAAALFGGFSAIQLCYSIYSIIITNLVQSITVTLVLVPLSITCCYWLSKHVRKTDNYAS